MHSTSCLQDSHVCDLNSKSTISQKKGRLGFRFRASNLFLIDSCPSNTQAPVRKPLTPQCSCSSNARQHYLFLKRLLRESCLCFSKKRHHVTECSTQQYISESCSSRVLWGVLTSFCVFGRVCGGKKPTSVVSGSSFLHAGGFRFGDVLVVGLVLEFPTEVLDSFVQAFLQGYLSTQDATHAT